MLYGQSNFIPESMDWAKNGTEEIDWIRWSGNRKKLCGKDEYWRPGKEGKNRQGMYKTVKKDNLEE